MLLLLPFSPLPAQEVISEENLSQDAIIETGDAQAETNIESTANVTEVNSGPVEEEEVAEEEPILEVEAKPEEELGAEELETVEESSEELASPEDLDVEIENGVVVENEAETEAETGENEAVSEEGDALISTGDAFASTNVVTVVNLNIIESNGFLYLLNNFLNFLGHVDLRITPPEEAPEDPCSLDCGALSDSLEAEIENDAMVTNALITRSNTGANSALADDLAAIWTGNAFAGANIINIANTNIIDSNYLLFAFNNFGDWNGDLIFPNAETFSALFSQPQSSSGLEVKNDNSAGIANDIEVVADTGENEGEGSASINTGNALASTNVSNTVNTNLVNSSTFFVVFRIFGSWNGSVFNAPEGISWAETSNGIELFSDGEGEVGAGELDVDTNNTANITNNVKVFALTGDNKVNSEEGEALISTGNAYAGANILNIANTNVISSNWVIALINIFGNWSGNVSFGQPDLWVATQIDTSKELQPGSELIFHTTIANHGDASASNVVFIGDLDQPLISLEGQEFGEPYTLEIGNLAPGELREFSYTGEVTKDLPYGEHLVNHTLEISAVETDANPEDNQDAISLITRHPAPSSSSVQHRRASSPPRLSVVKTNSALAPIYAPGEVEYNIAIDNDGGAAYDAILYDVLKDPNGNIVSEGQWDLEKIYPDEKITVTYTAVFSENTIVVPGIYTNSAWIEALGNKNPEKNFKVKSDIATSFVTILGVQSTLEKITFTEEVTEDQTETPEVLGEYIEIPIQAPVEESPEPENTTKPFNLFIFLLHFVVFSFAGWGTMDKFTGL